MGKSVAQPPEGRALSPRPARRANRRESSGLILTLGARPDGLDSLLFTPEGQAIAGILSSRLLHEVEAACEQLRPPTGLLLPETTQLFEQQEHAVARRLWKLLTDGPMSAIGQHLNVLLEGESAHQQLLIDARSGPLRNLPFELLEHLDPHRRLQIVRVVGGGRGRRQSGRAWLEVVLWSPVPDDPICRRVGRRLEQALAALPRTRLVRWGDEDAASGNLPLSPGAFRVVHVLCHGTRSLDQVVLRTVGGQGQAHGLATESVVRWLHPLLQSAGLVVLDVCDAGSGQTAPLDTPAMRLALEAGTMCLAPRSAFASDASSTFSHQLYRSLHQGATLLEALRAGRNALVRLNVAHPSCRWWGPVGVVPELDMLTAPPPLFGPPPAPIGWPSGEPGAEQLLYQACALARGQDYLGVEHIIQTLLLSRPLPASLELLLPTFRQILQSLPVLPIVSKAARISTAEAASVPSQASGRETPAVPIPTPRLERLLSSLPQGFDLLNLQDALLEVPWISDHIPRLSLSSGEPDRVERGTLEMVSSMHTQRGTLELHQHTTTTTTALTGVGHDAASVRLEVQWGPRDGESIPWMPEAAGRAMGTLFRHQGRWIRLCPAAGLEKGS